MYVMQFELSLVDFIAHFPCFAGSGNMGDYKYDSGDHILITRSNFCNVDDEVNIQDIADTFGFFKCE